MQNKPVMTWKEAASYLRVSTNTLRAWVNKNKLVPARIGDRRIVFLKTELDRFLADSMKNVAAA